MKFFRVTLLAFLLSGNLFAIEKRMGLSPAQADALWTTRIGIEDVGLVHGLRVSNRIYAVQSWQMTVTFFNDAAVAFAYEKRGAGGGRVEMSPAEIDALLKKFGLNYQSETRVEYRPSPDTREWRGGVADNVAVYEPSHRLRIVSKEGLVLFETGEKASAAKAVEGL